MKKKTLLIAVAAIVLAVVSACSVTLAWLTAESGSVENTFTVGNVKIELWEHAWSKDAETIDTNTEVTTNDYKVVPGANDEKDPFVRVKAGSEACYVYVAVTNNLVINKEEMATINWNTGWTLVDTVINAETGVKTYLYRYDTVVDARKSDADIDTSSAFTSVTYEGPKITSDNIATLSSKKIVVKAYAHQSQNLTTGTEADTAAKEWAAKIANAG